MKPIDRYRLAYERKEADRVPFWFEMEGRGAQLAGLPWKEYMEDPKRIASASIKATKWFGMDLVYTLCSSYYFCTGWGIKLKWHDDPRFNPDVAEWAIKGPEDYDKLHVLDPKKDGMMPQVFKAVELISDQVGEDYPIQLWCFSPLTSLYSHIASPERMEDLLLEPDAVHRGLRAVTDNYKEIMKAFRDAGGNYWQMVEAHANPDFVSLEQTKEFAVPYDTEILKEAHRLGMPTLLNMNTSLETYWELLINPNRNYLDCLRVNFKKYGAPLSQVDWKSSLRHWKQKYGKDFCLMTGPDSIAEALHYTPEQLEVFAKEMLEIMAPGGGFILGVLGCGSPEMTDENLFALRRAIDKYGVYSQGKYGVNPMWG